MSQNTSVLGLKKPEGSDPFLASDFAANWQKIDDAIGQLQAGGTGGGGDTGSGDLSNYYTKAQTDSAISNAITGHTQNSTHGGSTGGTGSTDLSNYYTKGESDGRYKVQVGNAKALSGRYAQFTPDSAGYKTLSHGFGFTPGSVTATPFGPTGGSIPSNLVVDSFTATTFRVRVINHLGNPHTQACIIMFVGVGGSDVPQTPA